MTVQCSVNHIAGSKLRNVINLAYFAVKSICLLNSQFEIARSFYVSYPLTEIKKVGKVGKVNYKILLETSKLNNQDF